MEYQWQKFIENLLSRLDGPLHFRFIFQPLMAIIFAIIDGISDSRMGKPAYLWAIIQNPEHRRELLRAGWKSIGKIFLFAVALDIIYQIKIHEGFHPLETLIVAIFLSIVPYLLIRGPVNRLMHMGR
jgi:hypothetical protein